MGGNRGQTAIDFAVGMSTLLLVFAFVLTFVPGILSPFTASGQEETVVADRVADHLAEGLLAESRTPYVLNTTCTVDFLNDTANPDCRYSGENLSDRVGISKYRSDAPYRQQINVSILNASAPDGEAVLCWDGINGTVVERGDPACDAGEPEGVILHLGDTPPDDSDSVVAARRVVSIDGRDATLSVRVW